ncbi:ATP-binding protein, partial [Streptomyces sp. NPDC031705]
VPDADEPGRRAEAPGGFGPAPAAWNPGPPPPRVPHQGSAPEEARPCLPRRRAQQHLAPQLRDTPIPRRADATEQPVHDPGLMAAFQRGFGLAQADEQA